MSLHPSTFEYLKPTDAQMLDMSDARAAAAGFARAIDALVPDGPDKTYIFRKLREIAMWINVAITRQADGTPRNDVTRPAPRPAPRHNPDGMIGDSRPPIRAPHGVHEKQPITINEIHDHDPPGC